MTQKQNYVEHLSVNKHRNVNYAQDQSSNEENRLLCKVQTCICIFDTHCNTILVILHVSVLFSICRTSPG